MSTEYYNSQWQMPNEANKSKQANHSLSFDGNNYITGGGMSFLASGTAFSMGSWINFNTLSASGTYMGVERGSGNQISIKFDHSSGELDFTVNNGGESAGIGGVEVVSSSKITANTWHHIMMVYNGSATGNANRLKAFIDGLPQTLTFTGTIPSVLSTLMDTRAFNIGGSGGTWGGVKKMINACLFDYALSASQITTLYGDGSTVSNINSLPRLPVTYYPLSNSIWNGSNYITPNNAVQDYVFNFYSPNVINTGNSLTIIKDLTLSGWVNFTSTSSSSGTIISKHISSSSTPYFTYQLYIENNGAKFRIGTTTYTIITGNKTNLNDGKWHHILGTYDGSNINLYVDGVSDATAVAASGDLNTAVKDTTVGAVIDGGTGSIATGTVFLGNLSNIKIFNKALSAPEVETLYNYGSPIRTLANIPQNSNLKAWYKLDASEIYNSTSTEWEVYNNAGYEKTYSFNGSNNIQIPNNSSIQPTNWTIGFWVKGFGQNGTYLFNNSPNGWNIKSSGNDIIISIGTYQSTAHRTATNALNGKWNYIVFSYSGTTVRGSLNGGYLNYTNASGQTYDSSNLFIGSYSDGTNGFVGEIGQILFWNTRKNNVEGWTDWGPSSTQKPITSLPTPQSGPVQPGNNTGTANLVSWWKLDAATITDSFGSNTGINNGAILSDTIIGRPTVIGDGDSSGMSRSNLVQSDLSRVFNDNALSLPGGSARYAHTGSGFHPSSGSFTFSMWLRGTSTNRQGVFSNGSGFTASEFGVAIAGNGGDFTTAGSSDNGKLIFFVGATSRPSSNYLATSEVLENSKWYNLVATYTPGDLKLYLNGSFDNSTTSITKSSFSDERPVINACFVNGWNYGGQSSNWAFFDTVLSATEVKEIWNNGLPGNLKSHSKAVNLKNWVKGARGVSTQGLMDYVAPIAFTGSYTIGPAISTGFTDFQGTSTSFNEPAENTNITNDAPYSDKNAVSYNMASMNNPGGNAWVAPSSGRTTETPQAT